jgi:hypothetical protein
MLAAIRRVQVDVKTVLSGDSPELEALAAKVKNLDRLKRAIHAFTSTSNGEMSCDPLVKPRCSRPSRCVAVFLQQLHEVNDAIAAVYPVNQPLSACVAALWRGDEVGLHSQALQAAVDGSVASVTTTIESLRAIINQHQHLHADLEYYHDKVSGDCARET